MSLANQPGLYLIEIDAIIDNLPSAIIVVGQDRKVLLANKMAAAFARTSKKDLCGRRGGDAIGCVNSRTVPEGCGFAPACELCKVRQAVQATFETHGGQTGVESEMAFIELGLLPTRIFTNYLRLQGQDLVILALEDVSEEKIQEQMRVENARLRAAAVCHEMDQPLVASETAPAARSGRRVNATGAMHKRILVVDDETAVCELMTKAFARVGCAVIAAEYAEEAIAAAKTEMFPVMFIDLNLPGMNGIDLFKAIKALHPSSEAYLITGYASESDLRECRSAGFRDCLMKPISFPVLFQAAQAALTPRDDIS